MKTETSGTGQEAIGHTMKIYFCDICNESIPLKDINSNRITIEEGKIFCQKCAPKKAKVADRIPGAVLAVVLLLLAGSALMAIYGWRVSSDLDQDQQRLRADVVGMSNPVKAQGERLTQVSRDLDETRPKVNRLGDDLQTMRAELQQRISEIDKREARNHDAQMKAIQEAAEQVNQKIERELGDLKKMIGDLQVWRQGMDKEIEALKAEVESVRAGLRERGPTSPGVAGSGGGESVRPVDDGSAPAPAADKDALENRETNALIAQLSDSDPGKRYEAIINLGRYSGAKVVKALEGMLSDAQDYVRVAAIQNLRKLGSVPSIPLLIGTLRDSDYFVRTAAFNALRALTSATVAFDPDASPTEREARVKDWERWWNANKDRLLK